MTALHYKSGTLWMEKVPLESIVELYGTPLYCYSAERIAVNYHAWHNALRGALGRNDGFTVCYACKANSNMAVLRLLQALGAGADVVSGGEMYRAFRAGIPAAKMVFSGVGKDTAELTKAIKNGILSINVESESELELISSISAAEGKTTAIAFRVNPDVDAKTHAKITTGLRENKFGVNIEQAPGLYRKAQSLPGVTPTGVAVHIGSQLTELAPFRAAFVAVADLVRRLRDDGHAIATVDLGGGLGIRYRDSDTPPALQDYAALVHEIIAPLDVHVVVEPGRSIVGDAGVLVSRVLHKKTGIDRAFLILDAAMNDLMRPALYDAHHPLVPYREPAAQEPLARYDVVGPVCETADTFLTDTELPAGLQRGDLVVLLHSGAYGATMSSNYNTRPLTPEVLVSDRQFDLIRRPQRVEDLANADAVPVWLK